MHDLSKILDPTVFVYLDPFLLVERQAFLSVRRTDPNAPVSVDDAMERDITDTRIVRFAKHRRDTLRSHWTRPSGTRDTAVGRNSARRDRECAF